MFIKRLQNKNSHIVNFLDIAWNEHNSESGLFDNAVWHCTIWDIIK